MADRVTQKRNCRMCLYFRRCCRGCYFSTVRRSFLFLALKLPISRYLRIFSHGGAQLRLISIPGQIVTIAANLEQLFYVYHRGRGFEGEQYMACGLITIKKSFKKKRQPLPVPTEICLSSGARLSWAGFTDEGTPAIYDSRGVVKIGELKRHSNFSLSSF